MDATTARLLPAEDMALTVARAQLKRGENPPINTTTVLVMALDRLVGPVTVADACAELATLARDSLVAAQSGEDRYWVGPFEDDITELGIRAALWETEENDGGNRADLMLQDWADLGYGPMTDPWQWRYLHGREHS